MTNQVRILIVDPDTQVAELCRQEFGDQGWTIDHVHRLGEATSLVRRSPYHVILIDVILPDALGLDAWRQLHQLRPDMAGIIITASPALYQSLNTFEEGVLAFLLKPLYKDMVMTLVDHALQQKNQRGLVRQRLGELEGLEALLAMTAKTRTPREIIHAALSQLQGTFQAEWHAAYVSSHGQVVWMDHPASRAAAKNLRSPVQSKFVAHWMHQAVQSREVQILGGADRTEAALPIPRDVGFKAIVVAPVVSRSSAFGALAMVSTREFGGETNQVHIKMMHIVSQVTALALENARLVKQVRVGSRTTHATRVSPAKVRSV